MQPYVQQPDRPLPNPNWKTPDNSPTNPRGEVSSPTDTGSFLNFGETTWVLSAFKLAEDSNQQFVLRGYESGGEAGHLCISDSLGLSTRAAVNLLEQATHEGNHSIAAGTEKLKIAPWQVTSLIGDIASAVDQPPTTESGCVGLR